MEGVRDSRPCLLCSAGAIRRTGVASGPLTASLRRISAYWPVVVPIVVIAQTLFLGENLLPLLVLAFGGALVAGNGLALIRPPADPDENSLPRAPLGRTIVFMLVGAVMTVWALASLLA